MREWIVTDENACGGDCHVEAEDAREAAVKGAEKLGLCRALTVSVVEVWGPGPEDSGVEMWFRVEPGPVGPTVTEGRWRNG